MNNLTPTYAEAFVQAHRTQYRYAENPAQKHLDAGGYGDVVISRNEAGVIEGLIFSDSSYAGDLDLAPSKAYADITGV